MTLRSHGWAFLASGTILVCAGFTLYVIFLGLVTVRGIPVDPIAASTNLVVVGVGMGLLMSGFAILWKPSRL